MWATLQPDNFPPVKFSKYETPIPFPPGSNSTKGGNPDRRNFEPENPKNASVRRLILSNSSEPSENLLERLSDALGVHPSL